MLIISGVTISPDLVEIDTQWNVNCDYVLDCVEVVDVEIDTQWNVNCLLKYAGYKADG